MPESIQNRLAQYTPNGGMRIMVRHLHRDQNKYIHTSLRIYSNPLRVELSDISFNAVKKNYLDLKLEKVYEFAIYKIQSSIIGCDEIPIIYITTDNRAEYSIKNQGFKQINNLHGVSHIEVDDTSICFNFHDTREEKKVPKEHWSTLHKFFIDSNQV